VQNATTSINRAIAGAANIFSNSLTYTTNLLLCSDPCQAEISGITKIVCMRWPKGTWSEL